MLLAPLAIPNSLILEVLKPDFYDYVTTSSAHLLHPHPYKLNLRIEAEEVLIPSPCSAQTHPSLLPFSLPAGVL